MIVMVFQPLEAAKDMYEHLPTLCDVCITPRLCMVLKKVLLAAVTLLDNLLYDSINITCIFGS